jgi:DNA-binding helix-hairpin-helix protein with protein kinase domain
MNAPLPDVIDGKGQRLRLGSLLGRGGEGVVYEISGNANLVAKIYHAPLAREKADKLRLMVSLRNDRVGGLAAWPVDVLSTAATRAPIGLLMPKIAGRKDIHHLYSPKSRRTDFDRADWRFLIRASANTARAFGVVHETGCVIGDVNHGGVLVAQDATVRLIDCDSFQIINGSRRFLCEVGVETFTPPELQGQSFKSIVRTENHDSFGLAVLIFLLLFMGRHPFAGRFLGPGDMPIPRAIKECRFPYGARRASVQMEVPPGTPPLSIVGDETAFLFERAFAREMIAGGRPGPRDWIEALARLEKNLKACVVNPAHWHRAGQPCPWCPIEAATGVSLFPFVAATLPPGMDVATLWREVENLPQLGPAPSIPSNAAHASAEARALGAASHTRKLVASAVAGIIIAAALLGGLPGNLAFFLFVGGIAAFFGVLRLLDKTEAIRALEAKRDQAARNWTEAQKRWSEGAAPQSFDAKLADLARLRRALDEIPRIRLAKHEELKRNHRETQMHAFLDRFELDRAKIAGIGPGRKQTLSSYGIETAADITPSTLGKVPGFGPKTQGKLLDWRRDMEARFRFDPSKPIDPRATARVEREVLIERQRLEMHFRAGVDAAKQAHAQIIMTRRQLGPMVAAAQIAHAQAEADFRAAKGS